MVTRVVADVTVDTDDVERMLMGVNSFLEPYSLMGFLTETVSPYIRGRAKARFASEGDDASGKWAPLHPVTMEIRARSNLPIAPDHPINRRTGDLEAYITGSPDSVEALGGQGAQLTFPGVGTTDAAMQQKVETAQIGRNKPQTGPRPVLAFGMTDLAYVIGAIGIGIQSAGRR